MVFTRLAICSSRVSPNDLGIMEKVLEIPSCASLYFSFATEFNEAIAPLLSRPCIGFAPGAKDSPALRPSGVAPVLVPYMTLDVMVSKDNVGVEFLYVACFLSSLTK